MDSAPSASAVAECLDDSGIADVTDNTKADLQGVNGGQSLDADYDIDASANDHNQNHLEGDASDNDSASGGEMISSNEESDASRDSDSDMEDDDLNLHILHPLEIQLLAQWGVMMLDGPDDMADHLARYTGGPNSVIDKVLRLVDRAKFLPQEMQDRAYLDGPIRHGNFHHSAPHIYANALHELDIQPDDSFLNIGSGTGYLNTMVAVLQQSEVAVNHGVEIHANLVVWAKEKSAICLADLPSDIPKAHPKYFHANALAISRRNRTYDKMYIAQECTQNQVNTIITFLSSPGVCIVPIASQLCRVEKNYDGELSVTNVASVGFGDLLPLTSEDQEVVLELAELKSLKSLCRTKIRQDFKSTQFHSLPIPKDLVLYINYGQPLDLSSGDDLSDNGDGNLVGNEEDTSQDILIVD